MRINILGKSAYGSNGFTSEGGILSGPLFLAGNPVNPLEASTKNYVDLAKNSVSASNITTGTLSINRLPSFTGDFSSTSGGNVLTLGNSGVVSGSYTKVTVDDKGRVVAGSSLVVGDIPVLDWSKITSGKPTTLTGYGIVDGVNPAGDNVIGHVTLAGHPNTAYQLATKGYIDSLVTGSVSLFKTGDVIRRPSSVTPAGFLRCNGGQVSKTDYAALYSVVGDGYSYSLQPGSGQPWRKQYDINTTQSTDITGWTTSTSLPGTVGYSQAIVTSNRVYLLGGYINSTWSAVVYTAPILSDGTLGTWTTSTSLPANMGHSQAIVTSNRVYLLGGHINGAWSAVVYTAPILSDGTLGTWTTSTSLPGNMGDSQAIVTSNRVYLLGGSINGVWSAVVYTAPILSDGTLGTWTTSTSLPGTVGNSQAIVTKNRVYLLGGYNGSGDSAVVYTAPILSDGTLGTWTTSTSLPGTVAYSQAIVTSNRVYLLGGLINGDYSAVVYTAPILSDGTLGTWTTSTSLPANMGHSQAIVTSNRVYLLGGHINGAWSAVVYTAPILSDGTLGTWTTSTSLLGTVSHSQAIVTSNRVYLLGGYTGGVYSAVVYTAPFSGGLNDYSPYYDGSIAPTDPTNFRLPDLSSLEINGTYSYIKI